MEQILCVSNSYEKKYYLDPKFARMPESVRQELQILCVLFTEEVGGILTVAFEEDGSLYLMPFAKEDDILYDEIGSALKMGQIRRDHRELFESLELYYQLVIRKQEES